MNGSQDISEGISDSSNDILLNGQKIGSLQKDVKLCNPDDEDCFPPPNLPPLDDSNLNFDLTADNLVPSLLDVYDEVEILSSSNKVWRESLENSVDLISQAGNFFITENEMKPPLLNDLNEDLTNLNPLNIPIISETKFDGFRSPQEDAIDPHFAPPLQTRNSCSPFSQASSSSPLPTRKKKKQFNVFDDSESEEEVGGENGRKKKIGEKSRSDQVDPGDDDEDDSGEEKSKKSKHRGGNFVSDFDQMMENKKAERQRNRKRGSEFITDNDELIAHLIDQMEEAAAEDRKLNLNGKPATKKISMLKYAMSQLIKKDLQLTFLEHNILSTLTEWLSPLPNKSLPCLQIRESILRLLDDFPTIDSSLLKLSGIGKVVMYLFKHPSETKENRARCHRLIDQWARPIHDLTCDYRAMSKKERQQRDVELSLKYKKQQSNSKVSCTKEKGSDPLTLALSSPKEADTTTRPGDPGWVPRARVPQLSVRDYIKRPKSDLDCEISTQIKPNRFEMLAKKYDKARRVKFPNQKPAKLSIVGSKM